MESKPVGNIYEIVGNPDLHSDFIHVHVMQERDRAGIPHIYYMVCTRGSAFKGYPLDHKYFGRQIGFDATQTDEYKIAKAKLTSLEKLLECAGHLKAYYVEHHGGVLPAMSSLKHMFAKFDSDLKVDIAHARRTVRDIKSRSWMENNETG